MAFGRHLLVCGFNSHPLPNMAKQKRTQTNKKSFHGKCLGKNKNLNCDLYQDDCLERLRKLPDKSIDLVIMDPPYLFDKGGGGGAFGSRAYYKEIEPLGDGFDFQVLNELERVQEKTNLYIFSNIKLLKELLVNYQVNKPHLRTDLLIWHKTNPAPSCNNKYLSNLEYVLFVREKGVKLFGDYHTKSKVYSSQTNKKDKKLYDHPTTKPVPLLENYIRNSTKPGATVLDCFAGSSSTGEACLRTGRHFVGIELDPKHFKTGEKRLRDTHSQLTQPVVKKPKKKKNRS